MTLDKKEKLLAARSGIVIHFIQLKGGEVQSVLQVCNLVHLSLDCKTVRIFAYSSKREQSNKRSGTRLKTESETGERRFFSSRLTRPTGV